MRLTASPNFPSVAIDRSGGPRRGTVYVAWTDYAAGQAGPAGGIVYEVEPNDRFATATPVAIGDDISGLALSGDVDEDGDPDLFVFSGTAASTITIAGEVSPVPPGPGPGYPPPLSLGYEIRCGEDTTATAWQARGRVQEAWGGPLPPVIFTLPVTGRYYLKMDQPAYLYSYYYGLRLRRWEADPADGARDHRDLVLVRSSDGGATWSAKVRVNDDPPGFDNALPEIEVDPSGRLHAAWYDRRDDPVCGTRAHTYWTFSDDGGGSFAPARAVSSQASTWQFVGTGIPNIGDHLALEANGNQVLVLWADTRDGLPNVYGARIEPDPTGTVVGGFAAELAAGGAVRLRWWVREAAGLRGFRVLRYEGRAGEFTPLQAEYQPAGRAGEYVMEDRSVVAGALYQYQLEVSWSSGAVEWEGPVEVQVPGLAWRGLGLQATPNPFTEQVELQLAGLGGSQAWVGVYDVAGHLVARPRPGPLGGDTMSMVWDGRDRQGRPVPVGVYLVEARAGFQRVVTRLVRIR